jgi:hypothetical protein
MRVAHVGILAVLCGGCVSAQTDNTARQQLIETLDSIANGQLAERGTEGCRDSNSLRV